MVETSLLNQQVHSLEESLTAEKSEHQKLSSALEEEKLQQICMSKNLKEVHAQWQWQNTLYTCVYYKGKRK